MTTAATSTWKSARPRNEFLGNAKGTPESRLPFGNIRMPDTLFPSSDESPDDQGDMSDSEPVVNVGIQRA